MPTIYPITDTGIPELEFYRVRNEVQLLRYYEPKEGVFVCESEKVIRRALEAGYVPLSFVIADRHIESGAFPFHNFPEWDGNVFTAGDEVLSSLVGYKLTGGMLSAMKRRSLPPAASLCEGKRRLAVLEDIENPTNVGAIFRSAAALGIEAVLLTKGCADPFYRRAARVSMGTVFRIPWTYLEEEGVASFLHRQGFSAAALALSERAINIGASVLKKEPRLALILGNEDRGLSEETLAGCDHIVKIPMAEGVDSLNVAAASAVAFWELR